MRAFSRSPIRRRSPSDMRDNVRSRRESPLYRRDSPPYRREVRRISPISDSRRRQQEYRRRDDYYDYPTYSPKRRKHSRSRSTSSGYRVRRQSSSPDKSRTKQPRESRWDSHIRHRREEETQSNSDTQMGSGEEDKLIVVSKWVRRHSNNESE